MFALLALSFLVRDDVAEALKKFDTDYKSKDASVRATAVTELAKTAHEKVISKLGKLLVVDAKEVRLAAAAGLGIVRETKEQNKKEIEALARGIAPNFQDRSILLAIVEALDKFGEGVGVAILHQNFVAPDIPVARAAIEAAGEIRKKESIPVLILYLKQLEAAVRDANNIGPNGRTTTGGGLPYVGGNAADPNAPKRYRELGPVVTRALESITKKTFKTTPEWEAWWKKESSDFSVPP